MLAHACTKYRLAEDSQTEKAVITDRSRMYAHSDDSSEEEEVEEDATIPARQAQFTVRLLLDFLPQNQLEVFSWQTWEPLNADNFLLMCRKQKKLAQLEIGPMERSIDPLLEKQPQMFDQMTEITSIDVYPENVDRLRASQKLLKAKPKIKTLCVSVGFEYNRDVEIPPDLNDSSTRPGLLTRTLFSHMMPFGSVEPLNLVDLDLDTVELRVCSDILFPIVLRNLDLLSVLSCHLVLYILIRSSMLPIPGSRSSTSQISRSSRCEIVVERMCCSPSSASLITYLFVCEVSDGWTRTRVTPTLLKLSKVYLRVPATSKRFTHMFAE